MCENAYLSIKNPKASRALKRALDPGRRMLASLARLRFAMSATFGLRSWGPPLDQILDPHLLCECWGFLLQVFVGPLRTCNEQIKGTFCKMALVGFSIHSNHALVIVNKYIQWRIQDFLELGVPTPGFGAKTYYLARF